MRRASPRLLLIAILLAGFALRVYRLEAQSLWYDEGVTAWLAAQPADALVRWTANDIQPPLYYLLVSAWTAMAGTSEFSLRFVSLLAGVVLIALLYVLGRRLAGARAGLWTALLAAFHPALVYYAQEARMYALLLALGVLAAILLLPALCGAMPWRRWVAYAAVAALAAYTHYFAYFLLAALGVAWVVEWTNHRRGLGRFVAAHALLLLLYLPWLAAMLNRWRTDASYWEGTLKLADALRGVATRFTTGETVREQPATWIAALLLGLTLTATVWLWVRARERRLALRLALLWLCVPVVAALLLAATAPKFNPRYVLIALPGLLLLWAFALDALGSTAQPRGRLAVSGALLLLFAPFLLATGNWYYNGAFNKAQWRQVVEFLRPRLAPDERVVLVSGHAWPVWNYYAPDIPALRLPAIDVLDVDHVLTFAETAPPLRDLLDDYMGVWLVNWQEEVIDPNEVVPVQLELGGREKGSSARFSQLTLRRWSQIRPERFADAPPIAVATRAAFGASAPVMVLDGYRPLDNGDLLLFWHRTEAAPDNADYRMTVEVEDVRGLALRLADRRPGGYTDPTFRWAPGEIVMGRIPATDWLGPEPSAGLYTVRIGVYDAADPAQSRLRLPDGGDTLVLESVQPILE